MKLFTASFVFAMAVGCENANFTNKSPAKEENSSPDEGKPAGNPGGSGQSFDAGKVAEDGKFDIDETVPNVPIKPGSVKIMIGDKIVATDVDGKIVFHEDEVENANRDPNGNSENSVNPEPDEVSDKVLSDEEKSKLISGHVDYEKGHVVAAGDNIDWKGKPISIIYDSLDPKLADAEGGLESGNNGDANKEIKEVVLSDEVGDLEGTNETNDQINVVSKQNGKSCSIRVQNTEVARSQFNQDLNTEDTTVSCEKDNSSPQVVSGVSINFRGLNAGNGNLEMQCSQGSPANIFRVKNGRVIKCENEMNCGTYCGGNEYLVYTHVNFRGLNAGTGNLHVKCVEIENTGVNFGASRILQSFDAEFSGLTCAEDEIVTGMSVNFRGLNAGTGNLELRCTKILSGNCN